VECPVSYFLTGITTEFNDASIRGCEGSCVRFVSVLIIWALLVCFAVTLCVCVASSSGVTRAEASC
jgi:hypothetical protein